MNRRCVDQGRVTLTLYDPVSTGRVPSTWKTKRPAPAGTVSSRLDCGEHGSSSLLHCGLSPMEGACNASLLRRLVRPQVVAWNDPPLSDGQVRHQKAAAPPAVSHWHCVHRLEVTPVCWLVP